MHTTTGPIAVGINGTAASDAAVRYAVREAQRSGVGVKLIHALPDYRGVSRPFGMALADLAPTGRALLHDATAVVRKEWAEAPLDTTLVLGPGIKAILHASEGSSEIVLGCEQRSTVQRLATGTMVVGVAARAQVPVIAIAPSMERPPVGRITVGVKYAEESYALLHAAFEQAVDRECSLYVVHAWNMAPGYEGLLAGPSAHAEVTRTERKNLEEIVRSIAHGFPAVKVSVEVDEGNPARVLQSAAEASDLLLLARRRHAFPTGHIGGTARALLHHSSCPVAILAPADEPAHLATSPHRS